MKSDKISAFSPWEPCDSLNIPTTGWIVSNECSCRSAGCGVVSLHSVPCLWAMGTGL